MTETGRVRKQVQNDTIAAVSTPPAKGGIGIIRISGAKSKEIAEKIFKGSIDKSHTIRYGFILEPKTGEIIDEVLVSYMRGPKTYTTEDTVEINCHSGIAVLNRIMELLIENGARPAERGEFTKRAFLNGRIDLTRAEAVLDIINAKTETGRHYAAGQLTGGLYDRVKSFMERVLLCLANIEASIDYPEHSDTQEQQLFLKENIGGLLEDALKLYDTAELGRIVKDGINTVIIGETNVGKSSLLNYFAGCQRAIVTDIHGTTRDILEESVNLNGVLLRLSDTAGIRETDDAVEKIGVSRAFEAAATAELVLYVFDGSREQEPKGGFLRFEGAAKTIAVVNKCDLPLKADIEGIGARFGKENTVMVSLKDRSGLEKLESRIRELFFSGQVEYGSDMLISNIRHKNALFNALESLKRCLKSIEDGFPEDIVSIDLMDAYRYLGEITGDSLDEDLADKIFSEFCLGK